MSKNHYDKGSHNVIDDRTGFKKKKSECQRTWDNLIVDREGFENRHPQDFIKSISDKQVVAEARPDSDPIFLEVNEAKASDL